MLEYEHLIVQIFLTLIPVIGLYNKRLDNHDEQNKAILVLAEQIKSLGEDVRELKNLIQNKQ